MVKRTREEADQQSWVALHRLRTVTWKPSAVVALAQAGGKVVAAARQSGRIELWDPDTWACTAVRVGTADALCMHGCMHGVRVRSGAYSSVLQVTATSSAGVSALAWLQDAGSKEWALVSAGLSGQLLVHSPATLGCSTPLDSYGGAVWALAADPGHHPLLPNIMSASMYCERCKLLLALMCGPTL